MSATNSVNRTTKVAFVHIMRTGGTYVLDTFKYNNWDIINSWEFKYFRDWNKQESFEIASLNFEKNTLFHNHVVNWNIDILRSFKENGWLTFSIFRNPLDQLISLHSRQLIGSIYDFKIENPQYTEINEFIKRQIDKEESLYLDFKHWEIPDWWEEIDLILDYKPSLFSSLKKTFDLNIPCRILNTNSFNKSKNISSKSFNLIASSEYQKKYNDFKKESKIKLFVLITSCEKNEEFRSLLRRGWTKDLTCPYLFVIGDESGPSRIEDDILYVKCGDSYEDCPIKQYLSIKYVNEHFDFDHLFCCDDDTYVIVNRLMESGFENHDYYGGGPVHEQGEPHYVQGGAGIFLSQKAVQTIVDYPVNGDHLNCKWSDQMVGKIMDDAGIKAVYNKRFQMGHEEEIEWISRDYNRLISAHKLEPWKIEHADIDVNPFHIFDKIYWIKTDLDLSRRMEEQLEDADIEHLTTPFDGSYKDAVKDAFENKYDRILILTDEDVFKFKFRDLSRHFFYECRDWEIMCLGAEARRGNLTGLVYSSEEVTKFSGLGLSNNHFQDFLNHEGLIEEWLYGKEVFFPKRTCSSKNNEWYHCPEYVRDFEINKPIKCAMIVNNFKRGGAEIEFNEMLTRLDPQKVQWVGLAVETAFQFEISPDYRDKFPPVYVGENKLDAAINLEGAEVCKTFEEAILKVAQNADVLIKWHTNNPVLESLPHPSIVLSNTFGRWVLDQYRCISGDMYIGNSNHSGEIFWDNIRSRTIYSGHALKRLEIKIGRDKQRKKWGFNSTDKVVGYTGRIDMSKNLGTIIKAVSKMPSEYKLVFVGQANEDIFEEIQTLLEKYLPGRYHIDEWSHCVGDALSALDCFVLVSDYEGFSNSLAEAWMLDIPAVFSRCGAVMELQNKYGDIGVSVNVGVKPEHLANCIKKAMNDANKPIVQKIGKIMREDFTIDKSAKEWECAIQDLYKNTQVEKIKVGLFADPNEQWASVLLNCSCSNLMEIKIIDNIEDNFDVVISCGKDLKQIIPRYYNKPVIMVSGENQNSFDLAHRFVAFDDEGKRSFPKLVQNCVDIMPIGFLPEEPSTDKTVDEILKFNGLSVAYQWYKYLKNICDQYQEKNEERHYLQKRIEKMVKEMNPKRTARRLNKEEVPPPVGDEWTYLSVLDFIANS